ncbi:MAG: uracil-DNA glycosylase family protein [Acidobacteriota bacterium]
MSLIEISQGLAAELGKLKFAAPASYVYNPLEYASEPFHRFLDRFGAKPKEVLLVGMNPGPWGMAQTGVPFGAVTDVKEWLGIREGRIGKPPNEHPKRPVLGFECTREEVSGKRIWSWARAAFGTPERFFERFFITNYCPLLFLDGAGRNVTPDKLKAKDREALEPPCNDALRRVAIHLEVRHVVGVGVWAEKQAKAVLGDLDLEIGRILHPSPASPAANRGWAEAATREFAAMGIEV